MALTHAKSRRFTVDEYYKIAEAGVFRPGERVELIEGEIVPMCPQDPVHARRIARITTVFVRLFGATHEVRVQLPLSLGSASEPEPDFALVRLAESDRAVRHPACADLVLEVSHTSLGYDRVEKASLYARAGIAEYWVLNLKDRRLEVRRDPRPDEFAPFEWSYGSLTMLAGGEVSPGFAPGVALSVAEVLGQGDPGPGRQ